MHLSTNCKVNLRLIVGDWTCSILFVWLCDILCDKLSYWCINHLLYYFRWLLTGILDVFGIVYMYWLEIRYLYSKTCVKRTLQKRQKNGFQDQSSLNAGQKYCRMLQEEHSAILLTFIKLHVPIIIKIFLVYLWVAVLHGLYCACKQPIKYQESTYRSMCT